MSKRELDACIALASERGYQIISTRPTESEARFSYMGLGDLLEGLGDEVPLPVRQGAASDKALRRGS